MYESAQIVWTASPLINTTPISTCDVCESLYMQFYEIVQHAIPFRGHNVSKLFVLTSRHWRSCALFSVIHDDIIIIPPSHFNIEITIFWDVTSYSLVGMLRRILPPSQ
jgi:hypothetical protein